jgi:gluconolactonase
MMRAGRRRGKREAQMSEVEIREVTDGLRFPEGPIALPDGSVLVVEIARRCLTRVAPDGSRTIVAEPGGGPNGAALVS